MSRVSVCLIAFFLIMAPAGYASALERSCVKHCLDQGHSYGSRQGKRCYRQCIRQSPKSTPGSGQRGTVTPPSRPIDHTPDNFQECVDKCKYDNPNNVGQMQECCRNCRLLFSL